METNTKQQQLLFDKGITNVPSDALCSDNTLEDSIGLIYDDGEHKVIQQPSISMRINEGFDNLKILFVHKLTDVVNYIGVNDNDEVRAGYNDNGTFTAYSGNLLSGVTADSVQFSAIGKTLIINTGSGVLYFLWKPDNNNYTNLGSLPVPSVEFAMLVGSSSGANLDRSISASQTTGGCVSVSTQGAEFGGYKYITVNDGMQQTYNDLAIGLYSKCLNEAAENEVFCEPFFVRYGLEMYDGSFTQLSAPILMLPAITRNCYSIYYESEDKLTVYMSGYPLAYRSSFDYSEWTDIIKDVVVFASDGIKLYDTANDQSPRPVYNTKVSDNIVASAQRSGTDITVTEHSSSYHSYVTSSTDSTIISVPIETRTSADILEDVKSTSVFYRLFSIGMSDNGAFKLASSRIKEHVLETLTSQEVLDSDDYYSHCHVSGNFMTTYNNRLILANLTRGFYDGYDFFLPYDNSNSYTYDIYVYIRTAAGTRIVHKQLTTYQKIGRYFYYPDPRAYQALVFIAGAYLMTITLEEHPSLNGAYYISLPTGSEGEPSATVVSEPLEPTENVTPENLANEICVSEVNNPFVFKAEGNVTIGSGSIIGVSSLTQALSQGQFGQYPLIAFTSEGIWAASTGNTGLFMSVHPMSREVALTDNPCITQTDGAVFFASKKGLMVVVGSDVKCVSEQLSGKSATPFPTYLESAFIAYDYRDSLLWIFNGSSNYSYIYAIKTGTFARYDFGSGNVVTNVVNDYPDYLLQIGNVVYSLLERDNINDDGNTYSATMITRPMKLENALAFKTITQLRNIMQTSLADTLTLTIKASNNLDVSAASWATLTSLRGRPWKYYKFIYSFHDLEATDRFAGTVIVTQERRTDKLR